MEEPLQALKRIVTGEEEKVAWLMGAGFSYPLGGPLFSELLEGRMHKWVTAWLQWRGCNNAGPVQSAFQEYAHGQRAGLWTNAEECLELLDEAQAGSLTLALVKQHLGSDKNASDVCTRLSQFVAIATSFFVDKVSDLRDLPEAWSPYQAWAQGLSKQDTLISFNYDRVVEELGGRQENLPFIIHLHGIVPEWSKVRDAITNNERIKSISTPGPSKLFDSKNKLAGYWQQARGALKQADRVVVIGYSFPPSDPVARSFILESIVNSPEVTIVLGPGEAGDLVAEMFKRRGIRSVRNTGLYVQQYLAEGRVEREGLRFNHRMFHLPPGG